MERVQTMRLSTLFRIAFSGAVGFACSSQPQIEAPPQPAAPPVQPTASPPPSAVERHRGTGRDLEHAPNGAAYPTANIGYRARSAALAGNRIPNLKFLGYPNGDSSKGLQQIALSDYYDPSGKIYKVIQLVGSSVWCGPCNQETDELVAGGGEMSKKGLVIVQALLDGNEMGKGAVADDLVRWVGDHQIKFTVVLDPNSRNLGPFFDAAAVPWNGYVDARSMEILQAGVGMEEGGAAANEAKWLAWVEANEAQK